MKRLILCFILIELLDGCGHEARPGVSSPPVQPVYAPAAAAPQTPTCGESPWQTPCPPGVIFPVGPGEYPYN
jgi:hypothetical protein